MRCLTSKDGDISSYSDEIIQSERRIFVSSLKLVFFNNHEKYVNKGEIKGQLPSEHFFGFCKTFKKISERLVFHTTFKTDELQGIIYTISANDITNTINNSSLDVPILIPSAETHVMFIVSLKNGFALTFDSQFTDK